MRFNGRGVVITGGGGGGLGGLLCRRFAAEGANVVVCDVDGDRAATVAADIVSADGAALAVEVDVSSNESVERMRDAALSAFGHIDVLVNNATRAGPDAELSQLSEEAWRSSVDVVLQGAFFCTRAVLPSMVANRRGSIINMGSVNGLAYFGNEAYSAAKAGVGSLTRSVAVRYGRHGVRANMVAPGTLRTNSPSWEMRQRRQPDIFARLGRWYPLGRVGVPEDIAPAVLFLASDDASWISGAVLPIDGGLMAGNPMMVADIVGGDPSDAPPGDAGQPGMARDAHGGGILTADDPG